MAEPDALIDLLDRIVACGYSGPVTQEKKDAIVKYVHFQIDFFSDVISFYLFLQTMFYSHTF